MSTVPSSSDSLFDMLQRWYESNCDSDWEHTYGIKIETLDNPGWAVSISLQETDLESRSLSPLRWKRSEADWVDCRVENSEFRGAGGARNLSDIIRAFLEWAR